MLLLIAFKLAEMSEMSLIHQLKLIEEMKQYNLRVVSDVKNMRDELNRTIKYLRQEGLPPEVVDGFMGPLYMGHVNKELDELLDRMHHADYRYLDDVQQKLEDILKW